MKNHLPKFILVQEICENNFLFLILHLRDVICFQFPNTFDLLFQKMANLTLILYEFSDMNLLERLESVSPFCICRWQN